MKFSYYLMALQQTFWPAIIKTLMLAVGIPGLAYWFSRKGGLVGAEQGVTLAAGLMMLAVGGLFFRAIRQPVADEVLLLEANVDRSDDNSGRDYFSLWVSTLPQQKLFEETTPVQELTNRVK